MFFIRHKASAFLIVMLVLVIGLGNAAHAMSMGCAGGGCDDLNSTPYDLHQIEHADMVDTPHNSANANHDACDLNLCHALVLLPVSAQTHFALVETPLPRQAVLLHVQNRVGTPDRPPNL